MRRGGRRHSSFTRSASSIKHLPESPLTRGCRLRRCSCRRSGFPQGMLVSIPLHLDTLPARPKAADLEAVLARHYAGAIHVRVLPRLRRRGSTRPALNGTDDMELYVFAMKRKRHAVSGRAARQSPSTRVGAAVQNLALMLGREADAGRRARRQYSRASMAEAIDVGGAEIAVVQLVAGSSGSGNMAQQRRRPGVGIPHIGCARENSSLRFIRIAPVGSHARRRLPKPRL